jgi:hypothetical protein
MHEKATHTLQVNRSPAKQGRTGNLPAGLCDCPGILYGDIWNILKIFFVSCQQNIIVVDTGCRDQ